MPNWCRNELEVAGEKQAVASFKQKAKGEDTALSLNNLYKMPGKFGDTVSPVVMPGWYYWRSKNWGIKWDVSATLVCAGEHFLKYEFASAWCPPVAWLRKVSRDYPSLSFTLKYKELGAGFRGITRAKNGRVIDKDHTF